MKILLIGNPNVGKSVIFSRLTGARVIASNYPGTTVELSRGFMDFSDIKAEVIDVPGTYSLRPSNKTEEVAVKLIEEADIIINVIDSTNLERNLYLTFELIRNTDKPLLVVLNMWDETKHKGIDIDLEKFGSILSIPAVATCALTGEGIKKLVSRIKEARTSVFKNRTEPIWCEIGDIVNKVQKLSHRHHTFLDVLEDLSIHPPFSYFIAICVIVASFWLIRFLGEGLINYLFHPFFVKIYTPLISKLNYFFQPGSFIHTILVGRLVEGNIDYGVSFGLLTTGIYVPFAAVLPYIFSFYLVLSLLEDWGYLPRLAILGDRLFHKLGLHGYAIVPMVLGLGCNVPGALATRLFEERREKFIAATLMAIAVPCMAQTAMIINVLGPYGGGYVSIVFLTLFLIWYSLGRLMNVFTKGRSPEILMEIPPYRRPHLRSIFKKLWVRIVWFLKEAIPMVLLGILIVNILFFFKIIDVLAVFFYPLMNKLWGLPKEAIGVLVVGFLRKDIAVGMLRPLELSVRQLIVGTTILAVYFPCVATFMVLLKELGIKDMLKSLLIMVSTAGAVGLVLNYFLEIAGI
ncbi:MAG: GTP-binding protein [Candidatus Omnitrophica bacterium]|nr:GTP-binding protein [Candidatus Omnitrophota bacterium]MBD3268921.1 GTP-binding protein [Candidatus Omnitrophota bacterium]